MARMARSPRSPVYPVGEFIFTSITPTRCWSPARPSARLSRRPAGKSPPMAWRSFCDFGRVSSTSVPRTSCAKRSADSGSRFRSECTDRGPGSAAHHRVALSRARGQACPRAARSADPRMLRYARDTKAPYMTLLSPWDLEARLRQIGAERYHNLHPFHRLLHGGSCDKGQVQAWALNRYYYQAMIPLKDASLIGRCDDPDVRREWRHRLVDHDGED